MKMTCSHTSHNNRRRTRGVAGMRGLYTVTHTYCSAAFASRDRDEDGPMQAGRRYNSASLKAPRRIFSTITTFRNAPNFPPLTGNLRSG